MNILHRIHAPLWDLCLAAIISVAFIAPVAVMIYEAPVFKAECERVLPMAVDCLAAAVAEQMKNEGEQ